MRPLVLLAAFCACSAPIDLATTSDPVLQAGGTRASAILRAAPRLAGLADAPLSGAGLADDDDGRLALSLLTVCALDLGDELDVQTEVFGTIQFFGELGLAPAWGNHRLNRERAELVIACVLAHLGLDGLPAVVSLRGPGLPSNAEERADWTVLEGRFFGQALGDGPAVLAACRGAGQFEHPGASGLVLRQCASPDPDRRGLTLCGLRFAGECASVCCRDLCEFGGRTYLAIAAFVAP